MNPSTNELMRESGVRRICKMFGLSNQTSKVPQKSGFSCTLISLNILLKLSLSHSAALPMRNVSWVFPQLSPTDWFGEMRDFVLGHTGPVKPGSDPLIIWDVTAVLAVSGHCRWLDLQQRSLWPWMWSQGVWESSSALHIRSLANQQQP